MNHVWLVQGSLEADIKATKLSVALNKSLVQSQLGTYDEICVWVEDV